MLTLGVRVGQDTVTGAVVPTVDLISSLPIVNCIVKELSVECVRVSSGYKGLIVSDVERRAPYGRGGIADLAQSADSY